MDRGNAPRPPALEISPVDTILPPAKVLEEPDRNLDDVAEEMVNIQVNSSASSLPDRVLSGDSTVRRSLQTQLGVMPLGHIHPSESALEEYQRNLNIVAEAMSRLQKEAPSYSSPNDKSVDRLNGQASIEDATTHDPERTENREHRPERWEGQRLPTLAEAHALLMSFGLEMENAVDLSQDFPDLTSSSALIEKPESVDRGTETQDSQEIPVCKEPQISPKVLGLDIENTSAPPVHDEAQTLLKSFGLDVENNSVVEDIPGLTPTSTRTAESSPLSSTVDFTREGNDSSREHREHFDNDNNVNDIHEVHREDKTIDSDSNGALTPMSTGQNAIATANERFAAAQRNLTAARMQTETERLQAGPIARAMSPQSSNDAHIKDLEFEALSAEVELSAAQLRDVMERLEVATSQLAETCVDNERLQKHLSKALNENKRIETLAGGQSIDKAHFLTRRAVLHLMNCKVRSALISWLGYVAIIRRKHRSLQLFQRAGARIAHLTTVKSFQMWTRFVTSEASKNTRMREQEVRISRFLARWLQERGAIAFSIWIDFIDSRRHVRVLVMRTLARVSKIKIHRARVRWSNFVNACKKYEKKIIRVKQSLARMMNKITVKIIFAWRSFTAIQIDGRETLRDIVQKRIQRSLPILRSALYRWTSFVGCIHFEKWRQICFKAFSRIGQRIVFAKRVLVAKAFQTWMVAAASVRALSQTRERERLVTINRYVARWVQKKTASVFSIWLDFLDTRLHVRKLLRRTVTKVSRIKIYRAVITWKAFIKKWHENQADAAVALGGSPVLKSEGAKAGAQRPPSAIIVGDMVGTPPQDSTPVTSPNSNPPTPRDDDESTVSPLGPLLYQGNLLKKSSGSGFARRRTWNSRWCKLYSNALFFCESSNALSLYPNSHSLLTETIAALTHACAFCIY